MGSKIYTTILQDANDGSGDAIVEFPQELIDSMGLKDGDIFNIDIINNSIVMTKIEK